jgi:hypothetical protein
MEDKSIQSWRTQYIWSDLPQGEFSVSPDPFINCWGKWAFSDQMLATLSVLFTQIEEKPEVEHTFLKDGVPLLSYKAGESKVGPIGLTKNSVVVYCQCSNEERQRLHYILMQLKPNLFECHVYQDKQWVNVFE